jgi:RNA polymerase II-associated factor 1
LTREKKSTSKPGQDFIYRLRFRNDLPQIPFDPKLLQYPHPPDRHYKYFNFSLLKDHRYELIHPAGEFGVGCNPFAMGFLEQTLKNPNGISH